jgi:hypothetical protein
MLTGNVQVGAGTAAGGFGRNSLVHYALNTDWYITEYIIISPLFGSPKPRNGQGTQWNQGEMDVPQSKVQPLYLAGRRVGN